MFDLKEKNDKLDIEKRSEDKSRFAVFFELLFRKFWNICKVNVLYVITSFPAFLLIAFLMGIFSSRITDGLAPLIQGIVSEFTEADLSHELVKIDASIRCIFALWFSVFLGTGPSSAGVTYILRNYAREEHAFIIGDWWEQTRENFGRALVVWLIDIFVTFGICIAILFYSNQGGIMSIVAVVVLCYAATIYVLLKLYIYHIMITFDCTVIQLFKNSLTVMMQEMPKALLLFLIVAIIHIGVPYIGVMVGFSEIVLVVFFVAEIFFLPALTMFMVNYFIYPKIEKYIKMNKQD